MNELISSRHNNLVDPQLHVWGWEIPVYLFLGGMAAGLMILSSLLAMRPGERSSAARWLGFAAPILVSIGMGALFLDLENRFNVWRFYAAVRPTSPMSWGAWILLAIYPVTLLAALAGLAEKEAAKLSALARRLRIEALVQGARRFAAARYEGLLQSQLLLGIGLGVYTGVLLGTLGARALWGSGLLVVLFLVSGVSTGAAFLLLFRLSEGERTFVTRWDLAAIAVELAVLGLFLVDLSAGGQSGRAAAALVLGGPYTAPFWSLVVIGGLVVPLLLEAFESRLHLRPTLVAPALVLIGGLSLRWILVSAGQA